MIAESLVRISLPMPPSLNNAFINVKGKGRVRSENYRKWADQAGWLVKAQRVKPFNVPVRVRIEINPENGRAFDLDNRTKAVLDLLVTHGVLHDDSNKWVRGVSIEQVEAGAPCTVEVQPI